MFHSQKTIALVAAAGLMATAFGSLRVRISVPSLHQYYSPSKLDTSAVRADLFIVTDSTSVAGKYIGHKVIQPMNGDQEKGDPAFIEPVENGIWDGFDATTGFDNATGFGPVVQAPSISTETPKEPFVDYQLWLDSLNEVSNAPIIAENLLDSTAAKVQQAGYFAIIAGGITVPAAGEYLFVSGGRYAGLPFQIDVNKNAVMDVNERAVELNQLDPAFPNDTNIVTGNIKAAAVKYGLKVTFPAAGTYRFRARYWHHSEQTGPLVLGWRKAGDARVTVVPASAFGARKQQGVPRAMVTRVTYGDKTLTMNDTGYSCAAKTATYKAMVERLGSGQTVTSYKWTFSDTTIIGGDSISITPRNTSRPSVQAMIGGQWTRSAFAPYSIVMRGCAPTATISGVSFNNTEVTAATQVRQCDGGTLRVIGTAGNIVVPGSQLTYKWNLGDTTVTNTKTATSDTVTWNIGTNRTVGNLSIRLTVEYSTFASQLTTTGARTIEIVSCETGINPFRNASISQFKGQMALVVVEKNPVDLVLFNLQGKPVYSERFTAAGSRNELDLGAKRLNPGLYVGQIKTLNGATVSARVLLK